ncbi:hypothetical protein D3C72_1352690 [compost metagenome]
MHGRHALAAAQRQQGIRRALVALDHGAVVGRKRAREAAALRHAYRLAAQVFPLGDAAGLQGGGGAAHPEEWRRRVAQDLGALGVQLHGRDQQIDLAGNQELRAGGGLHLHQLGLHAQALGQFTRQFGVPAHQLLRGGVQRSEHAAIGQHADGHRASLPNLVQRGVGVGRAGSQGQRKRECHAGRARCLADCHVVVLSIELNEGPCCGRHAGKTKKTFRYQYATGGGALLQLHVG